MSEQRAAKPAPVRSQPLLPLRTVFGRADPAKQRPFPLSSANAVFTYSGTAAIYQAFQALGIAPGGRVLCPSYNCGHEVEPLVRLGLDVDFYRVAADLAIDMEDVAQRLRAGVKALLVTHYFGFAQPLEELRKLCDQHGAYLVEDCAHALFSDNAPHDLGRVGDVAIFSMRKSLPIPNGGALIFNNRELRADGALKPPPWTTTSLKALDLVTKSALDGFAARRSPGDLAALMLLLPLVALSRVAKALAPRTSVDLYNPDDEDYHFSVEIMSWRMSDFSAHLLERIDWSDVIRRRRSNYLYLAEALGTAERCRPLLPSLPRETCPLYFPLWVERPVDFYYGLARERIYADVFWQQQHSAVDWRQFPEAVALKQHVIVLPVHQDVDRVQLERIANVIRGT